MLNDQQVVNLLFWHQVSAQPTRLEVAQSVVVVVARLPSVAAVLQLVAAAQVLALA